MKFNGLASEEWRRTFTTVVFALTALSCVIICAYSKQAPVQIGLLAVTMTALLFMFVLRIDNPRSLELAAGNNNARVGLKVETYKAEMHKAATYKGDHKPIKTVIGFAPNEDKSDQDKMITSELQRATGGNYSSYAHCVEGLKVLERHEAFVRTSWTQTLNKARLLRLLGKPEEAEALANDVLKRFTDSAEAVGIAHEVLSFIEEFKEPPEGGADYRRWLEKRKGHVMKGLAAFPTGHDLLMNAFEVSVLENDAEAALVYLNRAVSVDRERTQKNLANNPRKQKALGLSRKLGKAVRGLIEGDNNKSKIFEMIRVHMLTLLVAASFGLGTAGSGIKPHTHDTVSVPTAAAELLVAASAAYNGTSFGITRADFGTSFGLATADFGTSFGKTIIDFSRASTSFGR